MSRMADVVALDRDMVLIELAEECNELAHAALKLVRVHHGRTPVTEEQARTNLVEGRAAGPTSGQHMGCAAA